jgi:predicted nucleotidyltransferase
VKLDFAKFSSIPWLEECILFLTRFGSHAYGTNTPASDEDFKGFCVPPREYFLGFNKRFEQAEGRDPDLVIYDVRKFMSLAADCNPSIIEMLWTDASDRLIVSDDALPILEARERFLSKKAKHTFCGYAVSQLKRIRTHRRWLMEPPKEPPTRAQFGLPERTVIPKDQLLAAESEIKKVLESWDIDWEPFDVATRIQTQNKIAEFMGMLMLPEDSLARRAAHVIGYDENFIALLDKERGYRARMHEWHQYQNWKATRNPARAEIEAKHGYDCKHGYHLVRLMRMAREILETGKVIVKRPDREELLHIRNGGWSYDQIVEWAERQDKELDAVMASSKLPKSPDRAALDQVCQDVVSRCLVSL